MGKRYYVTGLGGFVGQVLANAIAADADNHICTVPHDLDIRDAGAVRESVAEARPDYVVHLAALSFVPDAFRNPRETFDVNFYGTLNLLAALRETGFKGRMLFVGSGDMYGLVPDEELPVAEDRPLRPRNPYAVSKVAAEALCYQWSQTEGLDVMMARPFNHVGPGQDSRFAVADFARQIAGIRAGVREPVITAGDVDAARDFTDVRDIVAAYLLLLRKGRTGAVYNVCSGRSRSLREIIALLARLAGTTVEIRQDPERLRPSEQKRMAGDAGRLRADTGWQPVFSLERTLQDTLDYWSAQI